MTAKLMDIETRIKVLNSVLGKPKQQQAVERELLAANGGFFCSINCLVR